VIPGREEADAGPQHAGHGAGTPPTDSGEVPDSATATHSDGDVVCTCNAVTAGTLRRCGARTVPEAALATRATRAAAPARHPSPPCSPAKKAQPVPARRSA